MEAPTIDSRVEARIKKERQNGINPYISAIRDINKNKDRSYLLYLLKNDNPIPEEYYLLASVLKSEDLSIVDLFLIHLREEHDELKDAIESSFFDEAIANSDVSRAKWILSKCYVPNMRNIDNEVHDALNEMDIDRLALLTDLGLIKGYIDPVTRDLIPYVKAKVAYEDPDMDYPRYPGTKRSITKMEFTGNDCS